MGEAAPAVGVALLLATCWISAVECRPAQEHNPVAAYNTFVEALRKGDLNGAYRQLSTPTREAVEKRAAEIAAASGGALKPEPANLIFGGGGRAQPLTELTLISQNGGSATVRASAGSFARNIPMVRESSGWKVDLTPWLDSPPQ